jgi:putative peptidoglycan lipid II flippase
MKQQESVQGHERATLARRSAYASLGVLLSRFSGVFRSQVVNAVFGASTRLDAFNVALRFPSVLRDLFAEGALSAAFTKELVEADNHGKDSVRELVSIITGFFLLFTLTLSLLMCFYAEPLISAVTSESFRQRGGFSLAVLCFRVLVFYLPIAMLSAVAMSILGNRGQTFRATIASAFFNLGTIVGALLGGSIAAVLDVDAIAGLAVGTLAGGILQFCYQVFPLVREGLFPWPSFSPRSWVRCQPLRSVLTMMAPRAVSQGALSLALFVNTHFATAAGEGAITYITNAQVIILVPVGLFGVAASFASLPMLSQAVHDRNAEKLGTLLSDSLQNSLWLSWLSLVAFAIVGVPFCAVLLEHGQVTANDTIQNAVAVCAYSIGMFFNSGSKVLMQGFYALNDVRRSVINASIYLFVNATLSFLLAPRYGIIGLGLSNSIAAAVDFSLNWYFLNKVSNRNGLPMSQLHGPLGKTLRRSLLFLALFAFCIGILGVYLASEVWLPHGDIWMVFGSNRFLTAFIWMSSLGLIWLLFSLFLLKLFGPIHLRQQTDRMLSRIKLLNKIRPK